MQKWFQDFWKLLYWQVLDALLHFVVFELSSPQVFPLLVPLSYQPQHVRVCKSLLFEQLMTLLQTPRCPWITQSVAVKSQPQKTRWIDYSSWSIGVSVRIICDFWLLETQTPSISATTFHYDLWSIQVGLKRFWDQYCNLNWLRVHSPHWYSVRIQLRGQLCELVHRHIYI